jgi:hypothetical protein
MFGGQRSCLALLSVIGALLVHASPGAAQTDPTLPPDCQRWVQFDPGEFRDSTQIDNEFLPLVPGTQLVLEGRANRGGGALPHTVTFTVTDLIKVIEGVPTRVMWDVDVNEGEVAEAELAFFAQDDDGNVWNLGEYPEEYEDGFFLGAPNTWIAGLADAEAGIHMLDGPNVGDSYLQGLALEVEFLDCATVFQENLTSCPPVGCFENVLLTHERSPLDLAGGIQTKAHAPGVGIVEVGAIDDPEGETLVLVERVLLNQEQMAAVREEALELDRRGYRVSAVYCQTEPIAPNPPAECPADQPVAPHPEATAPSVPGSTDTQTSTGSSAPSTPAPAAPKRRSRQRSCYAKRSRRSARPIPRRSARRSVTRRGSRVLVKKMPRKTCAELLSRR